MNSYMYLGRFERFATAQVNRVHFGSTQRSRLGVSYMLTADQTNNYNKLKDTLLKQHQLSA